VHRQMIRGTRFAGLSSEPAVNLREG